MADMHEQTTLAANAATTGTRLPTGLRFDVVGDLPGVFAAWQFVYQAYRRCGWIEANPFALHAHARVINDSPAVVTGSIGPVLAATLTAVADGEHGLPVDELFAHETQSLRDQNRQLMQLTLLADRRRRLTRCLDSLLEMMRLSWWYAPLCGATDLLMCTAADDAGIFGTLFGFQEISTVRPDPVLGGLSSVLLRLDIDAVTQSEPLRPTIGYFMGSPPDPTIFENKCILTRDAISGSAIGQYLGMLQRDGQVPE